MAQRALFSISNELQNSTGFYYRVKQKTNDPERNEKTKRNYVKKHEAGGVIHEAAQNEIGTIHKLIGKAFYSWS